MNTRYEFNMDVPPREAIRLMYVSKSRFGGDWNSVPHTHSCTEVFYCVDGRGQFNVEGKMLDVAPDDMVIVNPRTLHTELSYQANPLEYIVLGIEGIEILFDQKDHGYTMLKCGPQREELLSLMQLLLREIDAREDGCEMVCQDLTEVLLVRIVRMASVSLRDIIHVEGSVDPLRDIETINLELIFSDMEMLERRIDRTAKMLKGDKSLQPELDFFKRVLEVLEAGKPARSVECAPEEAAMLSTVALLTAKPVIYAANLSESDFTGDLQQNTHYQAVCRLAEEENAEVLPICAQMEADIADMDDEEKKLFLAELGLERSGLDRLIQKSYHLLGLISYLTAGQPEVRAWTITRGTKAPQAAGKIHTDFERGFIRAEVISYEDLIANGSMAAAREKGLVRSEGKEYVMQDGDVVLFRFNV